MFSPVLFGVRGVDVDLDVSVFVPSIRARSQVKPTGTRERERLLFTFIRKCLYMVQCLWYEIHTTTHYRLKQIYVGLIIY